jgi:hypothetical protein
MRELSIALSAVILFACTAKHADVPDAGNSDAGALEAGGVGAAGSAGVDGSHAGVGASRAGSGGVGGAHAGNAPAADGGRAAGASGAAAGHAAVSGSGGGSSGPAACSGVFCEDFERGQLDITVWTRSEVSSGNSATVQSSNAAHGHYAMQFHATGGSRYSLILHDGLPDSLQKHYFGRLYYSASGFPNESGGHTAYITSSDSLDGFPDMDHHLEVSSYFSDSGPIWQLGYWSGDGPEYIGSGGEIPVSKWFCLEWEFNDAPDQIAVWVDGDAMQGDAFRNINNQASNLIGKMTAIGLGFRTWHPMGAPDVDLYIDDVVLDTKRVGCLP